MSHEVLIQDLRRKSSERIKQVRLAAEAEVEKFRSLKREELERLQNEVLGQLKNEAEKVAAPILYEAEQTALAIEDEAMRRLSERLYAMAAGMLDQVRQEDYESVFAALLREIPVIAWERVQVNPLDKELARSLFPAAVVESDASITGGFRAIADGGRYQVVNTLERRLEKGWQEILSLLLQEIGKEQNAAPAA